MTGQNISQRSRNEKIRKLEAHLCKCRWKVRKFSEAITAFEEDGNRKMVEYAISAYDTYEKISRDLEERIKAVKRM